MKLYEKSIHFGDSVLIIWDCQIMDSDMHTIFDSEDDTIINYQMEVFVW